MKNKIYFASDVHLGSTVFENPRTTELRFVRWLDSIRDEAKALYLLGDVFDFWYEYSQVVPRGFTRTLGKLAEMHDAGTEIHFFIGNHDIWVFDYLSNEIGAIIHREPLVTQIGGKNFYLAHGDGLGDDSRAFHFLRRLFRSKVCQFLFGHFVCAQTGVRFGRWWSERSRRKELTRPVPYRGRDEHLIIYAENYLRQHPDTDYLIFGHRHILLDYAINPRSRLLIIGDWIHYFSYAVFDGENLLLEQGIC